MLVELVVKALAQLSVKIFVDLVAKVLVGPVKILQGQ